MSKTRNQFTTEFKQECVNLVVNQGYGIGQAASAMHVGLSSMQRWVGQYKQELLQRSLQIHEAVLISLKDQYSAKFGNLSVPKIKNKECI